MEKPKPKPLPKLGKLPKLTFDEKTHSYKIGRRKLPSVTEILKSSGVAKYTSNLTEEERLYYMQRGTAVHVATQYKDQSRLDASTVTPEILAHINAWEDFKRDWNVQILSVERKLYHPKLFYAGTVDRVAKIDGVPTVIDIKTGSSIYPHYALQLAAYALMVGERGEYARMVVHLEAEERPGQMGPEYVGKYKPTAYGNDTDFTVFMSCLSIANWKMNNKVR